MYTGFKHLHSYLPYLLLAALVISIIIFAVKASNKSEFNAGDKRIALITLILTHLQLVIGAVLYFISPITKAARSSENMMSDATNRLYVLEHPLTMIIAIVLITMGYSKMKRKTDSGAKFRTGLIFFSLALLLILARIPWGVWPA